MLHMTSPLLGCFAGDTYVRALKCNYTTAVRLCKWNSMHDLMLVCVT